MSDRRTGTNPEGTWCLGSFSLSTSVSEFFVSLALVTTYLT